MEWRIIAGGSSTSVVIPDDVLTAVLTALRAETTPMDPYRDGLLRESQLGEVMARLRDALLERRQQLRWRVVQRAGQTAWREWMGPDVDRMVAEDALFSTLDELLTLLELARIEGVDVSTLGR